VRQQRVSIAYLRTSHSGSLTDAHRSLLNKPMLILTDEITY